MLLVLDQQSSTKSKASLYFRLDRHLAIGYFYINDVAEYNKAIAQNRDAVISDFKNYTNIQPVVQISEIKHLGYNNTK